MVLYISMGQHTGGGHVSGASMVLSTVRVRVAAVNMRQAPRTEEDRVSEAIRVLPMLRGRAVVAVVNMRGVATGSVAASSQGRAACADESRMNKNGLLNLEGAPFPAATRRTRSGQTTPRYSRPALPRRTLSLGLGRIVALCHR